MKKLLVVLALFVSIPAFANTKDVVKVFENATVETGASVTNAVVVFGDLNVEGTVRDHAVVIGGDLNVSSNGGVLGKTVVIFGSINKEPGAEVADEIVELSLKRFCTKSSCSTSDFVLPILGLATIGLAGLIGLFAVVGFLAIFLLISLLFTDKVGRASYRAERHPWWSIYHGLIVAILVLPVTLFLVVSIIGIPVVPVLFIILSAATFFGYTVICQLIGVKFFRAIKRPGRPMIIEVIVGFIILAILSCIPVAGFFIKTAAWLAGLGVTVDTRFGTRPK
ncbi:MAG: hypothetical protein COV46_06340 [Deltaproteobacteria bacterium CG11_big_fil_rev_8_21_14_0_20_49_13]|nr:MAG: hypothetical protein COV46_06340 [Deltaproteobacteria bacterium CG11_big_fil_rev_8_21_14_0_20_49_13]